MNALFNDGGISAPAENDGSGVKETWLDNVVVLTASGALDLLTTPRLQDAIDVAATKPDSRWSPTVLPPPGRSNCSGSTRWSRCTRLCRMRCKHSPTGETL